MDHREVDVKLRLGLVGDVVVAQPTHERLLLAGRHHGWLLLSVFRPEQKLEWPLRRQIKEIFCFEEVCQPTLLVDHFIRLVHLLP